MKYIGLDISTYTGWSLFEDDVLLERGTIQLIPGMDLPQKLHYFSLELENLLTRSEPDYCFIEDVILAISGAKTLSYLARLNGVAINTVFSFLQSNIRLYEPTYWKSNSYDGLMGNSKKWQVQLAVINHYKIPITGDFSKIYEIKNGYELKINNKQTESSECRTVINKKKAILKRKRNPPTQEEIKEIKNEIKDLEKKSKILKQEFKDLKKSYDKEMDAIGKNISAQTGITNDISDSCGVAYCGYKDIQNV